MPRQANGTALPPANTAAVSNTSISTTAFNTLVSDIYTELTNSLDRGGRSAMTGNLPMGGNKITGMADPTVPTDAATMGYVANLTSAFFSTGDGKITLKTVADSGWVMADDGTIGSGTSGASNRANNDTQALFTLLFNNISDTAAPIFTSGGGATTRAAQTNAASAWAANCRMSLPKMLGRALAVAGTGSGLTARALGGTVGEETHLLSTTEIPAVPFSGVTSVESANHSHAGVVVGSVGTTTGGGGFPCVGSLTLGSSGAESGTHIHSFSGNISGGGGAHNNMQPTSFWNCMIKL